MCSAAQPGPRAGQVLRRFSDAERLMLETEARTELLAGVVYDGRRTTDRFAVRALIDALRGLVPDAIF